MSFKAVTSKKMMKRSSGAKLSTFVGKQQQIETRNTDDTKIDDCCQDRNGIILFQSCIFTIGVSLSFLMFFLLSL